MRAEPDVYAWPPASLVRALRAPSPFQVKHLLVVCQSHPQRPRMMAGSGPVDPRVFSVCAGLAVAGANSQVGVGRQAAAKEAGADLEVATAREAIEFGLAMRSAAVFQAPAAPFSTRAPRGCAALKVLGEKELQPRRRHWRHPNAGERPLSLAGGSVADSDGFAEAWARGAAGQTRSEHPCATLPRGGACARRNSLQPHPPLTGTHVANQPRSRAACGTAWSGHG